MDVIHKRTNIGGVGRGYVIPTQLIIMHYLWSSEPIKHTDVNHERYTLSFVWGRLFCYHYERKFYIVVKGKGKA
jgi:hypothetical protein